MNPPIQILYVEDEENDVFFMRNAFKRIGLHDCFQSVGDGDRAIAYLSGTEPYDDRARFPLPNFVLLDLNLPIRSGFEVLEWLRAQPQFAELPVVIFSSSGRVEDRVRAEKFGATRYILKPISGSQFLEVARQLADSWRDPASAEDSLSCSCNCSRD